MSISLYLLNPKQLSRLTEFNNKPNLSRNNHIYKVYYHVFSFGMLLYLLSIMYLDLIDH